jgi:hypothetical protein
MSGNSYCKTDSIPFHCALLDTCNILVLDLRALRRSMHNSAVWQLVGAAIDWVRINYGLSVAQEECAVT